MYHVHLPRLQMNHGGGIAGSAAQVNQAPGNQILAEPESFVSGVTRAGQMVEPTYMDDCFLKKFQNIFLSSADGIRPLSNKMSFFFRIFSYHCSHKAEVDIERLYLSVSRAPLGVVQGRNELKRHMVVFFSGK